MRVATLSMDVRVGDVDGNLAAATLAIEAAGSAGARLALLPEMWPTSFTAGADDGLLSASASALEALCRRAGELGLAVVGSAYGPRGGPRDLPSNRAHVVDGGEVVAHHDKVHLFTPTAEHLAFRPGDAPPPVVEVAPMDGPVEEPGSAARIAAMVCYDLRFPDVARLAFRGGAEVLCVSAQWPRVRGPHWRALLTGRAAELCGFVVGCNRAGRDVVGRRRMELQFDRGMSGVHAPDGRAIAPLLEEDLDAPGEGRAPTAMAVFDVEIEEARALRRAVPVHEDERVGDIAAWWSEARGR